MLHRLALAATMLLTAAVTYAAAPRLIVVISLDQFPFQYLSRFEEHFGRDGFRYLMSHGAYFTGATYKHAADITGPGHAVLLSGTYGSANGIVANTWYDAATHQRVYCVSDPTARRVGAAGEGSSPANFIGSTLGDMLRIQSGFRAKVISLSNKDRAAILMGGKLSTGTYWFFDSTVVTSTYYTDALPDWVRRFNGSGLINSYFGATWKKVLPEAAYAVCGEDDMPYEGGENGMGRAFPHRITGENATSITRSYYSALTGSPFGARTLARLAGDAVDGERLGARGVTDLLCVSFSSTDYVGHMFGPNSHEVLDMTVQMDRILADFFHHLDRAVGLSHCLIALTSDHGVSPIPEYIRSHNPRAEAGRVPTDSLEIVCNRALTHAYGTLPQGSAWVEETVDHNIYLNRAALAAANRAPSEAARIVADSLRSMGPVAVVYTREEIAGGGSGRFLERIRNSYHPLRSGDLYYIFKPYYLDGRGSSGTSHGDPYDYNAHVPLMFAGQGVRPGVYPGDASPADLAPTLSALAGIELPSGRTGRVLSEALGK